MLLNLLFDTGTRRRPEGMIGTFVRTFAAGVSVWVIYAAAFSRQDTLALTMTFLALMLVLTFLLIGPSARASRTHIIWVDLLLAFSAGVIGVYFVSTAETISRRITLFDPLSTWDIAFGSALLLLTMEAVRRTVGMGLTLIVVMFLVYNLFGDRLDGVLGHGRITYQHFLDITVFTSDGLFGVPLRVASQSVPSCMASQGRAANSGGSIKRRRRTLPLARPLASP